MSNELTERLAVCSWSLQPATPEELIGKMREIGLARMQLALDPLRENPNVWRDAPRQFSDNGMAIVSGMFGTIGEDYSTMESIRRTGGVTPDGTWEENWINIQRVADIAKEIGVGLVTFHAGFLPHEESDPDFQKLLDRIASVADAFKERGLKLGFETGQETAETLNIFLNKLNKPNVGVNFDPANMILYDKGDPIEALNALAPRLVQCHIKDARKTRTPGEWGEEVTVGTGEVDWKAFFGALNTAGYTGDLAIEREAGSQRVADIREARVYIGAI